MKQYRARQRKAETGRPAVHLEIVDLKRHALAHTTC